LFRWFAGEVCEQVNATLAPHGLITQYNSGPHREGRLERVVLLRERDLDADLPAQQVHKLLRAATEADANATKLQDAVATLQQLLDDAGQVCNAVHSAHLPRRCHPDCISPRNGISVAPQKDSVVIIVAQVHDTEIP
jgi:hypothetical protein